MGEEACAVYSDNIVRREIERTGHCRGCDKELHKGTEIIYTYTTRNRGQSIIFCLDCAIIIGRLVRREDDLYISL